MRHIFWLRKGQIAGRSGPSADIWDLEAIKSGGIASILSVNNADGVQESVLDGLGIAYANIPMTPNAPPLNGDDALCLGKLPAAMKFIGDNLGNGPVLIHCHSGKDRTAMVMAAYLIQFEGFEVEKAMEEVIAVRPIAFSAEGWMAFGREVLQRFSESQTLPHPDAEFSA